MSPPCSPMKLGHLVLRLPLRVEACRTISVTVVRRIWLHGGVPAMTPLAQIGVAVLALIAVFATSAALIRVSPSDPGPIDGDE